MRVTGNSRSWGHGVTLKVTGIGDGCAADQSSIVPDWRSVNARLAGTGTRLPVSGMAVGIVTGRAGIGRRHGAVQGGQTLECRC